MKISTIAIAAATLLTTVPAIAAADDPLKVIYKVSGVIDPGSASFTGIATVFFCTNFSNVPEVVRISLRAEANGAPTNNTYGFSVGETRTFVTHEINAYSVDAELAPGVLFTQASAILFATTTNVHCSATQIDAAAEPAIGIPLHMVRFRPATNSRNKGRYLCCLRNSRSQPPEGQGDENLDRCNRGSNCADHGSRHRGS